MTAPWRVLPATLGLTAVAAAALAAASPARLAAPGPAPAAAVVTRINDVRAQRGLPPLRVSTRLAAAARAHSSEMGERGFFGHQSADGTPFDRRVRRYYGTSGFSRWSAGENIFWAGWEVGAAEVVDAWMKSRGHRAILLDRRWREVGVGIVHVDRAPGVFRGNSVTIVTADFGLRV